MADRYEEIARKIVGEHARNATALADLRLAIAAALREQDTWPNAVPIGEWKPVTDERVLIFVVHPQARLAKTPEELALWQGWCVGYWSGFNKGGWIWNGHFGEITHVAPLPLPPQSVRQDG
jgi:hypothetical protein